MENSYDLIVIGSGPGGYVAAIRAAQLGMKVACVDKRPSLGGTCLNIGCIPSKALLESSEIFYTTKQKISEHGILVSDVHLDFEKMMERKNKVVRQLTLGVAGLFKKNKITSYTGPARLMSNSPLPPLRLRGGEEGESLKVEVTSETGVQTLSTKNILIATGSVPIELPFLPLDHERIIDSTDALSLKTVPKRLAVIGGGYIGLEMGSVYQRLGSEVTLIESMDRIIASMDHDVGDGLFRCLKKDGMKFLLSHQVMQATRQGEEVHVTVKNQSGEESTLITDLVLVAVGRKPCTENLNLTSVGVTLDEKGRINVDSHFQTSSPGIYAVGDVIAGPMLAHKASEEGIAAVEMMAGLKPEVNYKIIPGVVYTSPEAASVGITENEAKQKGINFKSFKFPFMANGRSLASGNKDGFVKLIADAETHVLLGAHILAPHASELIAELVLALSFGSTVEDIALTIHAHPTLAEAVREAALGLSSGAIHL